MINLLVTDELVIVGIRHGAFADKLKPLFDEEAPMEVTDLKKVIGTDVVSLSKTYYDHDYNTIGVFATPKVRLGYLWANQAYAMKEWMDAHNGSHGDRCLGVTYTITQMPVPTANLKFPLVSIHANEQTPTINFILYIICRCNHNICVQRYGIFL